MSKEVRYKFTGIVDAAGDVVSEGLNHTGHRVLRYVRNSHIGGTLPEMFEEGDKVSLLITFKDDGEPRINHNNWDGAYEIIRNIAEVVVISHEPA